MHALTQIRQLTRNNAWSNLRLLQACERLSADDYAAKRTSFFPSLHETLSHILLVDWYYLDGLEGGGRGYSLFENMDPCPTLELLTAAQRAADQRLIALVDAMTSDADLDRAVTLQRRDGGHVDKAGDILLHLHVHQIHHRGQAHAMLSGTNVKPPQLDEFFLIEERVVAEAELVANGFSVVVDRPAGSAQAT